MTIDNKLKFDKDVDKLYESAARQLNILNILNILYRFRGIFDIKEKNIMYNTFILSNFNYCSIILHFCGKTASKKVEHIQERALPFMLNDKVSTYESLLCPFHTGLRLKYDRVTAKKMQKSPSNVTIFMTLATITRQPKNNCPLVGL